MNTERRLTLRQERFVFEYLASLNAAEAARKAGYSARYAREIGYQNLEKLHIRARMRDELRKMIGPEIAGPDEVLQRLTAAARGAAKEEVLYYQKGQRWKHVNITSGRDMVRALELLGKIYGLFDGKSTDNEPDPVVIVDFSNEEETA